MLNETQKAIIEATLNSIFFDFINELPEDVQVIACQAALAFPTFVKHLSLLKQYEIKEIVQTVGEILDQPAPQNPAGTYLSLSATSMAPLPPNVLCTINENIESIRKGYFNLLSQNEADQLPPTKKEVKIFIENLLKEKAGVYVRLDESSPSQQLPERASEQDEQEKSFRSFLFSRESGFELLAKSIAKQLEKLQGTGGGFIKCTASENLPFYQEFLKQFGREVPDTLEAVNIASEKLYADIKNEYRETLKYASMEPRHIPFIELLAAKLNDFTEFFKLPLANFYSFKALKRLALLNGHLDVYHQREVVFDSYETSCLLIRLGNYPLFSNYFDKNIAQELSHHCANTLVALCLSQPTINMNILAHLLNFSPVAPEFLNSKFSELMAKNERSEATFLVSRAFLRCVKFKQILSEETSQWAFQVALDFKSFEMQALVLNQSLGGFSARSFFNRETFFELVRQEFYDAAKKVVELQMPYLLSIKDLRRAEEISQGKFKLREDSIVQARRAIYWVEEGANPPLLTNFQRLQVTSVTNEPSVAAERLPTDENRPTLT